MPWSCCRSSSSGACRAHSSSRWRSPMGWPCWPPCRRLTVTPALCLILLANAPIERRARRPLVRWLHRVYARLLARDHPATAPGVRRHRRGHAGRRSRCCRCSGESLFPQFKERDFLMHWITKPGTSVPEERRIVTQVSRELRSIPGVRNFGSHIGQALLADEVARRQFRRELDQHRSDGRLRRDRGRHRGGGRRLSWALPQCGDLSERKNRRGADGIERNFVVRIYGPDLKGIHGKADEVEQALQGSRASSICMCSSNLRCPRCKSRSISPRPSAMASNPAMCAGRRRPVVRRRGRRPFQGRQGVRRERVEHARNAPTV